MCGPSPSPPLHHCPTLAFDDRLALQQYEELVQHVQGVQRISTLSVGLDMRLVHGMHLVGVTHTPTAHASMSEPLVVCGANMKSSAFSMSLMSGGGCRVMR